MEGRKERGKGRYEMEGEGTKEGRKEGRICQTRE